MSEKQAVTKPMVIMTYTDKAPTVEKTINRDFSGTAYVQPFTRNNAGTFEDVSTICEAVAESWNKGVTVEADKSTGESVLVQFFNSALDLYVRSKVGPQLEASVEGPAKTIEKAAKSLAPALGLTLEQARDMIIAQRKSSGLPVE